MLSASKSGSLKCLRIKAKCLKINHHSARKARIVRLTTRVARQLLVGLMTLQVKCQKPQRVALRAILSPHYQGSPKLRNYNYE